MSTSPLPRVGSHSLWNTVCFLPVMSRLLTAFPAAKQWGLSPESLSQVGKYEHVGFQYLLRPRASFSSPPWWKGPLLLGQHHKAQEVVAS